jgi:hypothetical protein
MVKDGYLKSRQRERLLEALLGLRYMEHLSPFVRRLARRFHDSLTSVLLLRATEPEAVYRAKRRKA